MKIEKKDGYEIRTVKMGGIEIPKAYIDGKYIGDEKDAIYLISKGIKPDLRTPTSKTCSVGFCEREQKWYGWSHRAICGFGIGDVVKKGSECTESLPIGFKAKSLADARKMAKAFAGAVS